MLRITRQTDAERKAAEIRDRASAKSSEYYNAAADQTKALRGQVSAEADKAQAEGQKKKAEAKSSWWSWFGWGSSKADEAKSDGKGALEDAKQTTKKEWEAVKKSEGR